MGETSQIRTYNPEECIVFLKTNERFGGLSNMARGYPLWINGIRIRTSEALYQASRYPHMPDVQRLIIDQRSPMTAKMRTKPYRSQSRPDWDAVRVKIMRWCLKIKLAQNLDKFGNLLLETQGLFIVEKSSKDDFWGTKIFDDGSLVGMNVLGRLLMELREAFRSEGADSLMTIEPLPIQRFLLFECPIEAISADTLSIDKLSDVELVPNQGLPQPSLFDQVPSEIKEPYSSKLNSKVRLKPYPEYQESGLPWIDNIPFHWNVRRNGRLFGERKETGFPDLPIMEVSLHTGVRVRDMEDGGRKQIIADRSKYKRAAKGDIAYNMMRMWQGAFGVAPTDGLISPAYVVARPFSEVDPRYYDYLFRTAAYKQEINKFSRAIVADRNRLYWGDFKQMPSSFPPTDEQVKISDYLDAHGRLIDKLIRRKQLLIGLLNEQKLTMISHAVTRGLNPSVEMTHTGLDWMPEAPVHWEVKRLKNLVTNVSEQTTKKLNDEVYVALENVESWSGIVSPQTGDVRFDSQVKRFQKEDILFGKLRPYLAKVTRLNCNGVCVGEFLVLRKFSNDIWIDFLEQTLRSRDIIDHINGSTVGAKMPRADWGFISTVKIAYPPNHEEQKAITQHIETETSTLSLAIHRTKQEISLIREYREHLVSDVVTGKVDIRNVEIVDIAKYETLDHSMIGEVDVGD